MHALLGKYFNIALMEDKSFAAALCNRTRISAFSWKSFQPKSSCEYQHML